jgi:hypothetical protein
MSLTSFVVSVHPMQWVRVFCVLSFDLVDVFSEDLKSPIGESGRVREILRRQILEHEEVFQWWTEDSQDQSAEPLRAHTSLLVEGVFDGVSKELGEHHAQAFLEWSAVLWGGLEGIAWPWHAYEMWFNLWAGQMRHQKVDILGFTWTNTRELVELLVRDYIEPVKLFRARAELFGVPVLSDWDAKYLAKVHLSLTGKPSAPGSYLFDTLIGPVRRTHFRTAWRGLLKITDRRDLERVHLEVSRYMQSLHTRFADRALPEPWLLAA